MGATLVAGCGFVGAALATRLATRGERVYGLRRSDGALPDGVLPLRGDLALPDLGGLVLPSDVTRVVFALAPEGGSEAQYRAAYVDGLAHLHAGLSRAGARVTRAVLTTSTAVYAQDDQSWVDERSETTPRGTAALLLEAETSLAQLFPEAVALRLAGIYGPSRDRMVRLVAEGSARLPLQPVWTNRIHRDDAASAIEVLLDAPAPAPVYIGVDDEPSELGALYRWIARELGRPSPPCEDAPMPRARGGNKRCRNESLRGLGWAPSYPSYREGYRDVIEAYRRA